jgi:uncharacterized membrane protein HdeD (DUF308 family)
LKSSSQDDIIIPSWLRAAQVIVGIVCVLLSTTIFLSPGLGSYTLLFLIEITLIIIGSERVASGITSRGTKRSSRAISIGLGLGIIGFAVLGFLTPKLTTQWLIILLGLGLLANGILRIIDGLRNIEYERFTRLFRLGAGAVSIAISILVLVYPRFGFYLLMVIIAVALVITGIELLIVGIKGKRIHAPHFRSKLP